MAQQTQADDAQTQTETTEMEIEVFHCFMGDRREDRRAALADDIRHQLRFDEREGITLYEFEQVYDQKGTETVEAVDDSHALHRTWERWNAGTGIKTETSQTFVDAKCRSMMVGDVVRVDGKAFICMPFGWERDELLDAEEEDEEDVDAILDEYDFEDCEFEERSEISELEEAANAITPEESAREVVSVTGKRIFWATDDYDGIYAVERKKAGWQGKKGNVQQRPNYTHDVKEALKGAREWLLDHPVEE